MSTAAGGTQSSRSMATTAQVVRQTCGDPYQEGELTLKSEQSITFEAEGIQVVFVPAPSNRPMRMCR